TPLDARSHYNALGITPSASQAEVKAAYYKLTKLYHPDSQAAGNSESEDHIKKFREVTAAYEVLGNVKLRRLYDKGMMHVGSDTRPHAGAWRVKEDDDPSLKFYRSRDVKSRPPPPTNNIPVYDFDEWSKQHYGATFAREQELKRNAPCAPPRRHRELAKSKSSASLS
ncbi:dnaJ homolog subfamily C member 30, mitochondrial-like, partial [Atheta coriaria]|uniref:dnaJ homolog subfamily C member 30, mitochondrial-like n=1 Tax=Dalotia coriaria TaxID=877792 RepID=UPI0031F3E7FD